MDSFTNIKEKIKEADMILVGIGEEFAVSIQEILNCSDLYQKNLSVIDTLSIEDRTIVECAIYQNELKHLKMQEVCKEIAWYDNIHKIIDGKNYFVVSVCNDDIIWNSKLDVARITTPRGSRKFFECSTGCTTSLIEAEDVYEELLLRLTQDSVKKEELIAAIPKCKECGSYVKPNLCDSEHYSEEGYTKSWQRYSKWLSGTLNKKLCILELGAGFTYPSLMRWPFERVTMLNQKAALIRVHKMFPQVEKEIAEKSLSVKMSAKEFIMEVSNGKADECK